MRKPGAISIAAAAVAAVLAVPGTAGAAPACAPVATSYGSAGAPLGGFPNDPLFPHQWGLAQIRAPQAWARGGTGAGATIAVVDSGIDPAHPDLDAKLVPGADLVSDQTCTPGTGDRNGHGTHVAGIAGASTNNGVGVAGTAPDAQLVPVRVLDASGSGSSDDVNAGIRWAADHGAHVINLSLGPGVSIGGLLDLPIPADVTAAGAAVDYAWSKGAVVVAAAGNSMFPLCSYPAAAAHAVCVAATDRDGFPSGYSNFPVSEEGGVAVRAPGGDGSGGCDDADIWSTYWPAAGDDSCGAKGYEPLAGTSMSTPFVSGLAAMLRGVGLSNQETVDCIRRTSSNGGRYDATNGYGIVNAEAAVAICTQLPPGGARPPTTTGRSTGPSPTAPEGGQAAGDTTAPRLAVRLGSRRAHVARAGYIAVRVRVSERARVRLRIISGRQTAAAGRNAVVLARNVSTLNPGTTRTVRVRLTRTGRKAMRSRRSLTVTLLALARDAAGNTGTAIAEGKIRR
jgi:subtilisin family serine protease